MTTLIDFEIPRNFELVDPIFGLCWTFLTKVAIYFKGSKSRNLVISGSRGQKRTVNIDLEHVFKAKKVMVWDVSRRFAKSELSVAKTNFFVEFLISGGFPLFF